MLHDNLTLHADQIIGVEVIIGFDLQRGKHLAESRTAGDNLCRGVANIDIAAVLRLLIQTGEEHRELVLRAVLGFHQTDILNAAEDDVVNALIGEFVHFLLDDNTHCFSFCP